MKKIVLMAFFVFLSGQNVFAFVTKDPTPAQKLKQYRYLMKEAYKANHYALALDYAKKVDSLQPNQMETKYIMGVSYLYTTAKTSALPILLAAKSKNYKPKEIDFYLGQAYHYSSKFDSAIHYFQKQLSFIDTTEKATEFEAFMFTEIKMKIAQCQFGKRMAHDSLHVEIKNLGPSVNTKYSEYNPVVNADESVLYFTSRRSTTTGGETDVDNKHFEDIYSAINEGGNWKGTKNIGKPVNTGDHEACIGISPDGQKLFVYRSKSSKASAGNILMAQLDGTEWKKPKKLGREINSKNGWESSACLTPDGKRLYFSSDRDGGLGGLDIYYSDVNSEGEWSTPVNVGAPINTPDNEDSPFMHFDGRTLFFSSDGHKTIGGFDIFTSTYKADSSKWTKPLNLGYPINTADDDMYFVYSADGSKGYFSSHRKDCYGEKDIYVVNRPNTDPNMIVIAGHVLDKTTNAPIYATITITDLEHHKVIGVFNTNKLSGKYLLALNFGVNHSVEIEADSFVFYSENINIPNNEFKFQHNQDFFMEKVKKGAKVTLNNIFFDFETYELRPESYTELDNLYEVLTSNPGWYVEISGHTDSIGPVDYNMGLAKGRALKVVNYLIEKGINPKSMVAVGYGEGKPVADNGTEEGRQLNRRTEFTIKEIRTDSSLMPVHNGKFAKLSLDDVMEKPGTEGSENSYKLKMKVHFLVEDGEHLTEYSLKQLDQVVNIMINDPKFKLKLLPSVDLVGGEYNNKKLYEQRARTVSTYLIEKGLNKDKITIQEFQPTAAARITDVTKGDIKKRRVEFVVE